mmetsp:Transcript_5189/g.32578  ORF Transcript_5189/g.32578 Transcript_5189/m.32578 type:complete len:420 (-) Transcript_5189:290-1549(-)
MLIHAPRQGNFLPLGCTHRGSQLQLCQVALHGQNPTASGHGPNVKHEHFPFLKLLHLSCFLISLRPHTKKAAQEEKVHFQLYKDFRKGTNRSQNLSHQTIRPSESGIHRGANTNQPARNCKLQVVLLSFQRHYPRVDRGAFEFSLTVLADHARPDFDLHSHFEDTLQNATARHATFDLVHFRSRLVHIERPDHNHFRRGCKISNWHGNLVDQVLTHHIDVVFELGGHGHNWGAIGDGALNKLLDGLLLVGSHAFLDEIHLVLQDDDVSEPHDLHGGQVLGGLWLGAGFIGRNEQQRSIHDRGPVQHGSHENIVSRTVHERHVTQKFHPFTFPSGHFTHRIVFLAASVRPIALRSRARLVLALVDFCIGIAKLDGDIPFQFVLEPHGVHAGNGFYHGGFPMGHVSDRTDVDGGLSGNHFW